MKIKGDIYFTGSCDGTTPHPVEVDTQVIERGDVLAGHWHPLTSAILLIAAYHKEPQGGVCVDGSVLLSRSAIVARAAGWRTLLTPNRQVEKSAVVGVVIGLSAKAGVGER